MKPQGQGDRYNAGRPARGVPGGQIQNEDVRAARSLDLEAATVSNPHGHGESGSDHWPARSVPGGQIHRPLASLGAAWAPVAGTAKLKATTAGAVYFRSRIMLSPLGTRHNGPGRPFARRL